MGKMRFCSRKSYMDLVARRPVMAVKPAMNPSQQLFIIHICCSERIPLYSGTGSRSPPPTASARETRQTSFTWASRDRSEIILRYKHGVMVDYFQAANKVILKSFRSLRQN